MKWCMYIVIVLAILVALYGCDESPVPAEAPPKVQQSDDASAAGLMLDTLWPSKEAAQSFLDMLKGAVAVVAEAEEMAAQTLAWAVGMGGNPAKIEYTSFLIRPKKPTDAEGLLPWVAEGHRLGQVPQFFASSNNVPKLVDIIRQSYPKEDIFADNLRNGLIQLDRVDQKTGRPIPPGTKDVYTSFIVRHRQPGDLGACPWVADGVSNTGTKRFYVSADTIQKVAERIRENFPDQSIFVDNGVNTNPVEIEMPGKEIVAVGDPLASFSAPFGIGDWAIRDFGGGPQLVEITGVQFTEKGGIGYFIRMKDSPDSMHEPVPARYIFTPKSWAEDRHQEVDTNALKLCSEWRAATYAAAGDKATGSLVVSRSEIPFVCFRIKPPNGKHHVWVARRESNTTPMAWGGTWEFTGLSAGRVCDQVKVQYPNAKIRALSPTDDEPKPAEWVCYPASTYQKNLGASAWVLHEKDAEHMKYPGPWFITDRTSKDCCDRLRKLWPNTKVEVHIQ